MCVCLWVISLQSLLACWLERKLATVLSCSGEERLVQTDSTGCAHSRNHWNPQNPGGIWRFCKLPAGCCELCQSVTLRGHCNGVGWYRLIPQILVVKALLSFKFACAPLASSVPLLPAVTCHKSIPSYFRMSSFKASQTCKGSSWK